MSCMFSFMIWGIDMLFGKFTPQSGGVELEKHPPHTIGVRQLAYFYWRTHDFGYTYLDTYAHFFPMIF